MITRRKAARARNMAKRAKRISQSAERKNIDFAEMSWRYNKADLMFRKAYGWLRLES